MAQRGRASGPLSSSSGGIQKWGQESPNHGVHVPLSASSYCRGNCQCGIYCSYHQIYQSPQELAASSYRGGQQHLQYRLRVPQHPVKSQTPNLPGGAVGRGHHNQTDVEAGENDSEDGAGLTALLFPPTPGPAPWRQQWRRVVAAQHWPHLPSLPAIKAALHPAVILDGQFTSVKIISTKIFTIQIKALQEVWSLSPFWIF